MFRTIDEAARDGIAVDIAQFLDSLLVGEDVEIVIAHLPEGSLRSLHCDGELDCLEGLRQHGGRRFAHEQMHVLGHDDVAHDVEVVTNSHRFQGAFEQVSGRGGFEVGTAVVTTEGYEVEVACLLVTDELIGHLDSMLDPGSDEGPRSFIKWDPKVTWEPMSPTPGTWGTRISL